MIRILEFASGSVRETVSSFTEILINLPMSS